MPLSFISSYNQKDYSTILTSREYAIAKFGLNELSTSIRLGAPKVYYFTPEGKIGDAATTYGEIQGIEFKKFAMPVDGTQYISLLDLISLAGYALQSETIDALIPAPAYATQVDAVHEALKRVIDAGV